MITRCEPTVQPINEPLSWQAQLAGAVTSPEQLFDLLALDRAELPAAKAAAELFDLRVPHSFIARMKKGDINDPLLQQVLPIGLETIETPGYLLDPLSEADHNPTGGIIHKYRGRLLMILGSACAVNCRFCFRRHFPYSDNRVDDESLAYIRNDSSIKEVIFSGGDPLANNDRRLATLASALNEIPHVETLRIHTRLPIVIPSRVNDELLTWFTKQRLKPVMVIHVNHANEINEEVRAALQKLKAAGVTLLNQTVALKGINDSVEAMVNLNQTLFDAGVMPYYLHLYDKVQNAAHFDLPKATVIALHKGMSEQLPGYLVPKLVREVAGQKAKTPVF